MRSPMRRLPTLVHVVAWPLLGLAAVWLLLRVTEAGTPTDHANPPGRADGCIEQFDADTDYFPDKVAVEDAVNFSVTYHRSYKVVDVREHAAASRERYVLVRCGAPAPALTGDLAGAQVIRVPVSSVYAVSTTQMAYLAALQRLDVLTGVATRRFLIGEAIVERARSAQVREFAASNIIDTELVVAERPSVVMTGGSASAELGVIRQAGIPVVASYEWLEPTALARGEWIKYVALFLDEERAAERHYADVKRRYRELSARATAVPDARKPAVMTGRSTRGEFDIAGGRSYVAALIEDAGGRYVWADDTAVGAVVLDLEAQVRRAGDADVWINGGGWATRGAMLRDEPRYALFKAYRDDQVWTYERRVNEAGASDYFSGAVARPDLVLADLVKIFHPTLVPEHELQWYKRVPH